MRVRVLMAIMLVALAFSANAQDDEFEPVDLPDNIAEKVAGLDQEKLDFLRGSGIFSFAGSHELLFERFKNKSPEDVEAYIDAMMRVKELMKFNPDTDMASIPLNTESPGFNSWKTRRPAEFDTPRNPVPVSRPMPIIATSTSPATRSSGVSATGILKNVGMPCFGPALM